MCYKVVTIHDFSLNCFKPYNLTANNENSKILFEKNRIPSWGAVAD
jgi:hypothetical protein